MITKKIKSLFFKKIQNISLKQNILQQKKFKVAQFFFFTITFLLLTH